MLSDADKLPEGYTPSVVRGFFYGATSAHPRFMTHWMIAGGLLFFHGRDAYNALNRCWGQFSRLGAWDEVNIETWYNAGEILRLLGLSQDEEVDSDRPAAISGEFHV